MSIGNIRNTNDLESKKRQYAEMLQLMIENEGVKEKRIADYKNPNKPPPVPPQYQTVADRQKDLQLQERTAIDNIKDLGVDFAEARSFVLQLEQKKDGIDNLVKLNTNFPAFKKAVLDKLNVKQLNSNSLLNAWDEFSTTIDSITGLKSILSTSLSEYTESDNDISKLPTAELFASFNKYLKEVIDPADDDGKLDLKDDLLKSVSDNLTSALPLLLTDENIARISNLSPIEKSQINNSAQRLIKVYKIPIKKDFVKYFEGIKDYFESGLTPANYVAISDKISAGLVVINRLLSSILNKDIEDKLKEFKASTEKLLGSLYTEVVEVSSKPPEIEEKPTSARYLNEPKKLYASSKKAEIIKYIVANKLYLKEPFRFYIVGDKGDIRLYSDDDITEILQQKEVTQTELQKLMRDYNASLTAKKSDAKKFVEEFRKLESDIKEFQKISPELDYLNLDARFYSDGVLRNIVSELKDPAEIGDIEAQLPNLDTSNKDDIITFISYYASDGRYIEFKESTDRQIELIKNELENAKVRQKESAGKKIGIFAKKASALVGEKNKQTVDEIYNYIMSQIDKLKQKNQFLERFIALRGKYPDYNKYVLTKDGNLRTAKFSQSIAELKNILLTVEFSGQTTEAGIKKVIKDMRIYDKTYDTRDPAHQDYPIQGFGMKKSKNKGGDLIHIDIGSHIGKNYKEKPDDSDSDSDSDYKPKKGKGAVQVYIPEDNLNRPKPKVGCGSKPYVHRRIKIGKGVEVAEQQPKYIEFGKFIIHRPQLEKNTLNFKYPSEGRVPNLPIVNIGDDFKDFIIGVLETGKLSDNQFNKLSQHEKDFFIKAVKGAGLENSLFKGKGKLYPDEEKKDRDRFNILKGEFDAGNNNANLIKELRQLVIKFVDKRIIPKKQGLEFLQQLE